MFANITVILCLWAAVFPSSLINHSWEKLWLFEMRLHSLELTGNFFCYVLCHPRLWVIWNICNVQSPDSSLQLRVLLRVNCLSKAIKLPSLLGGTNKIEKLVWHSFFRTTLPSCASSVSTSSEGEIRIKNASSHPLFPREPVMSNFESPTKNFRRFTFKRKSEKCWNHWSWSVLSWRIKEISLNWREEGSVLLLFSHTSLGWCLFPIFPILDRVHSPDFEKKLSDNGTSSLGFRHWQMWGIPLAILDHVSHLRKMSWFGKVTTTNMILDIHSAYFLARKHDSF